ncbi:TetR/AcrR family transcriptional regulator [Streptomyces xiamenensis]|uniref:TetR/AcrR family transcriptional regulator n=1 Tax=Streptomyces xiamenensis TaxID=408015 RepID=UPI0037D30225
MSAAPAERADAARNRRKILDAALRIMAGDGAAQISLDTVAKEADVGVGTVYRRFGDRAGLVFALLEDREQRFRTQLEEDPPPLGPGAPAGRRLRAFLHALVDLVVEQRELLLLAEASSPPARYTSAPYAAQHAHVAALLRELRPDADADADTLADLLLAPFAPSLIDHQLRQRDVGTDRIKAALGELADALARRP